MFAARYAIDIVGMWAHTIGSYPAGERERAQFGLIQENTLNPNAVWDPRYTWKAKQPFIIRRSPDNHSFKTRALT